MNTENLNLKFEIKNERENRSKKSYKIYQIMREKRS